jgi:hypothetical protein
MDAVKLPRLSVAKLMAVVALVDINLAAGRVLCSYDPILLTGLALPWLTLQVGLYRVNRRRGRVRMFWAGFIACGLGAMLSFYWATDFLKGVGRYVEPGTGKVITQVSPGSPMSVVWSRYDEFVNSCLEHLPAALQIDLDDEGVVPAVTLALVWSLPQLFIAFAAGLLAYSVVRRFGKTSDDNATQSPSVSLLSARI